MIDDARVEYELHGAREQNATTAAGRGFLRNDDASVAPELHGAHEQRPTTAAYRGFLSDDDERPIPHTLTL